jgi:hypothetical protein
MGCLLRTVPGNLVYHVFKRANGRRPLFDKDGDCAAFERSAKWVLTPFRVAFRTQTDMRCSHSALHKAPFLAIQDRPFLDPKWRPSILHIYVSLLIS